MSILDRLESIEKKIKGILSAGARTSEPMKIRQVILDEIEEKIVPTGGGHRVLPFNNIAVRLFAQNDEHEASLAAFFLAGDSLKDHIVRRLRQAGCTVPSGLSVQIEIESGTDRGADAFAIECRQRKQQSPSNARLTVIKGAATQSSVSLNKAWFNIGRSEEVIGKDRQGVNRRNDLVFLESGEDESHTVSRIHAHIEYNPDSGEYIIYDDNSERGTRIFREGRTIPVVRGSRRGVRLKPGDEVFFGQARVRFEVTS